MTSWLSLDGCVLKNWQPKLKQKHKKYEKQYLTLSEIAFKHHWICQEGYKNDLKDPRVKSTVLEKELCSQYAH